MKKNFGTRMIAILLAGMMIVTSQTFLSLGDTLSLVVNAEETQQEEGEQEAQQDSDVSVTYQEMENSEPSGETGGGESVSGDTDAETYHEEEDSTPQGQNSQADPNASEAADYNSAEESDSAEKTDEASDGQGTAQDSPDNNGNTLTGQEPADAAPAETPSGEKDTEETAAPLAHTDSGTGVRLTAESGVIPAGTSVTVTEKTVSELPDSAKGSLEKMLADEGLTAVQEHFYDITLGEGVQPENGKVQVWLPVSESFDETEGTLDAWYVDENGNVTNLKEVDEASDNANARMETDESGKRFYVFETEHFSLYGVTESREKLTVTASSDRDSASYGDQIVLTGKVSDESAALQWQYKNGDGSWTDIDGATEDTYTFAYGKDNEGCQYRLKATRDGEEAYSNVVTVTRKMTLEEAVDTYYGENGTENTASVSARLEETETSFLAGETFALKIDYTLKSAALFNYGDLAEAMFDTYDDTVIRLRLPEGLSVHLEADKPLTNVTEVIEPAGDDNVWTFVLNDSISALSDTTGSFLVNILIDGNGKQETGHEFVFGTGKDLLEIETNFQIKDYDEKITKINPTSSEIETITTRTDDEWIIKKETAGEPVFNDEAGTVTVSFKLAVGLKGEDGSGNDTVLTNPQTYGRPGRVPFDGKMTLTEIPSVTGHDDITPESITVRREGMEDITVTDNNPVELPLATCGEQNPVISNVDADAPYYTEYTVDVVYDADEFTAKYSDTKEKQEKLTVENTARIAYTLAGDDKEKTYESYAEQATGRVTPPAELTIEKYMVDYEDGKPKLYSAENYKAGDPVSNAAAFTVKGKDGEIPTLYHKNADGTYTPVTDAGRNVSIDPAGTASESVGTDGKITVWLDAGEYTVSESGKLPANTEKVTGEGTETADDKTVTIAAGEKETVSFYNRELLGSITIEKEGRKDSGETNLPGAVFGIYMDENCTKPYGVEENNTATTDQTGTAVFGRLPYGTYYVKEISAPEGYLRDTNVYTFTIRAGEKDQYIRTQSVVNKYNNVYVTLQKIILDPDTGEEVNVGASNYEDFAGRFALQRTTAENPTDSDWKTVEGKDKLSLDQNGQNARVSLPAYDADGKPYTYRFVERLPEGLHGDGETTVDGERLLYSSTFGIPELENYIGESDAYTVGMQNWQNGSIDLTKRFWKAGRNSMVQAETGPVTATFDLYYKEGEDSTTYTKFNEVSYKVKAGETLSITDLPRTMDGHDRYYYLVETSSSNDYKLSEKDSNFPGINVASKTTITVGDETLTAFGPFNFTEELEEGQGVELEQSITIDNVKQEVPVLIKKADAYDGTWVDNTKFAIYEYDDGTKEPTGNPIVESTGIALDGTFTTLTPGKKYIVVETEKPDGYTDVTDTKKPGARIIDLTDVTVDTDTEVREVTLINRPDPKITVTKKIQGADGTASDLTGVRFGVYRRIGEGNFEPVNGYDNETELVLTSGENLQLPAGKYYLKEIVPEDNPNGIVDPSEHEELYEDISHEYDEATNSYYFGPYTVKDQEKVQNLATITNFSDKGAVEVTKYRMNENGQLIEQEGAQLSIYKKGEAEALDTQTSVKDTGKVTFKGLPVYDESGDKIVYEIRETKAPDGFTASAETLEVTLEAGKTVTTGINNEKLQIINQPETSLLVTKYYYNVWEHEFTQKQYPLPGTVIALYRLDEETEEYVLEETQTTNEVGEVRFTGLTQKDEYVAVEVSVPSGEEYKYLEPKDGKEYLAADEQGNPPATIAKDEITQYNIVTKEANTGNPQTEQSGELINVENWTQLKIEKYAIGAEGHADENQRREINNAEFMLYCQEIDLSQGTKQVLSFDPETDAEKDGVTLIGTYTSGTLYNTVGERMDGYFATDILKSADNLVYWLVETKPGIGASIKPENAITLFYRGGAGLEFDNGSTYNGKNCDKAYTYEDNTVTEESVENNPEYGGDGEMFSTVRIAKWAGRYDEDGTRVEKEYTPLGNATFDLYLADENGALLEKLDTMTTGLDNDLTGAGTAEGTMTKDKSAWASSKAFSWTDIKGQIDNNYGNGQSSYFTDESGNGYVRVALVERDAPAGYLTDNDTYYMLMFFEKGETQEEGKPVTESFNDAFYVKVDGTEETEDIPLAEETAVSDSGIVWNLYPTKEGEDGYEAINKPETGAAGVHYGQSRLVNWPVDNFAVTVTKYGYTVKPANMDMNAEALDSYYAAGAYTDRVPLANVTMLLQRWNGTKWEPSSYADYSDSGVVTDGRFTTGNDGYFAFPKGLNVGRYRIVELFNPNTDYENIYDGTTADSHYTGGQYTQAAYYFTVSSDNVDIRMYNPKKLSLDILKTDVSGNEKIEKVAFTLTDSAGNTVKAETETDGIAHMTGIGSGTYKLTESVPGTSGYVDSYFKAYFKEAYGSSGIYTNLDDLVNGAGIYFGFDTKEVRNDDGTYGVTVSRQTDITSYGIKTEEGITLTVKNPEKGGFTVEKKDKDTNGYVDGAKFAVEHHDFTAFSGDISVSEDSDGWEEVQKDARTTEGKLTLSGLEPGIYRITETSAPDGYDRDEPYTQYIALTGGMHIGNVTVGETEVKKDTDADYQGGVVLTFTDSQKLDLTIEKTIDRGALTLTGKKQFTFHLYDKDKNMLDTKVITCTDGGEGTATFADQLSQGKTYYLKEAQASGFALTNITVGGEKITPVDGGYYEFTAPEENEDVTVQAENQYLAGEVKIFKADGNTGEGLDGTEFAIYKVTTDAVGKETETPVSGVQLEDIGNGFYHAVLPLDDGQETHFRIYETSAPTGYLKDTVTRLDVTLSPGDSAVTKADPTNASWTQTWKEKYEGELKQILDDLIFPNYRGAYVDITKYANVKESAEKDQKTQEGVTLVLYEKEGDTWKTEPSATAETDKSGYVHFMVTGGSVYAVGEPTVPTGWKGMEGLYQNDTKAGTVEINGQTCWLLNGGEPLDAGVTYTYQAYNIPYVELEIRKQDAQNPTSSSQPTAVAEVYEITEEQAKKLTKDRVEDMLADGDPEPVLDDIWVNTPGEDGEQHFNYANNGTWSEMGEHFIAGKTYLVVERSSSVSQIRDNSSVVWYDTITIPEGTTEKWVVTLKNIDGSVELNVRKTAQDPNRNSLFTEAAEVTYTITPTIGDNTYPLDSFTLDDTGLTAYHGKENITDPLPESYLKGNYSMTEVTVGQATHSVSGYLEEGSAPINATVTFYDFDKKSIGNAVTKEVSSSAQTFSLSEAMGEEGVKAASFTVSYEAPELKKDTRYALGTGFTPGAVNVKVTIDKQEGGEGVQSIDRIRNAVDAEAKYTPWTENGAKAEQKPVTANAVGDVLFREQTAALVSVTKTADTNTVELNDEVTYTITIKNESSIEGADLTDPFIADLLPQGSSWVSGGEAESLQTDSKELKLETISDGRADGENLVYLFFEGKLGPGQSASVKLKVKADPAVCSYGTTMANYVLVGSELRGAQSQENPQAASFKNTNEDWAGKLEDVLTSLDDTRMASLEKILGSRAGYGYISARADVNWAGSSDMALSKSGYGDRNSDDGYSMNQLATVSNGGEMHYRLTAANTSGISNTQDITLVDILPAEGDYRAGMTTPRASEWQLYFGSLDSVFKVDKDGGSAEISGDRYKVFYYTGDIQGYDGYQDVYSDAMELKYGMTGALPTGWTDKMPTDTKTIRAFAVALSPDTVTLHENESVTVEYTASVEDYPSSELSERAYKNAVNTFACHYSTVTDSNPTPAPIDIVLGSNAVSNTILPEPVKVGGHIWIDRNGNGVREDNETINNFKNESLVQTLLDRIEIELYRYNSRNDTYTRIGSYDHDNDAEWENNAEFIFDGLDPAMLKENVSEDDAYGGSNKYTLNPTKLKGTDPATYRIFASIPSEETIGKFKLTMTGKTNGRSRNPKSIPPAETTDSNFTETGTGNQSELFYLWATDPEDYDNSKDIGFVLYRDLTINKKAKDGEQPPVKGAEFKIYGPFEEGTAAEAIKNDTLGAPIATETTDENGKISVPDLLWYQEYVIVETDPGTGYTLEGAEATAAEYANISKAESEEATWILGVPKPGKPTATEEVNVTNVRTAQVELAASKAMKKNGVNVPVTEGSYEFELRDENHDPLQTRSNDAKGKVTFDAFTVEGEGEFTYYINEKIPAGAAEGVKDGVTYDQTEYKVTVTTTWEEGEGLKASYTYEKKAPTETEWTSCDGAVFTNEYHAYGKWEPEAFKTLTGRDMKDGEKFYFCITENGTKVSEGTVTGSDTAGKDGEKAKINFEPIEYDLSDTGRQHHYLIFETDENGNALRPGYNKNGIYYDTKQYQVTVTVQDNNDGTLKVTPVYPAGQGSVSFENKYKPTPIFITPQAEKILDGSTLKDKESFEFKIEKTAGPDVTFKGGQTASVTYNAGDGGTAGSVKEIPFGEIEFAAGGTYTFRITETTKNSSPGANTHISYDEATWTLTVVVKDDGNGNLSIQASSYSSEDSKEPGKENAKKAVFRNTYTPEPAKFKANVGKTVEGNAIPEEKTFSFLLEKQDPDDTRIVLPAENTLEIKVREEGVRKSGTFGDVTFTEAGEYTLKITETTGSGDGYQCDVSIWTVTVKVEDRDGALKVIDTVYYKGGTEMTGNAAEFVNKYDPGDAVFTPEVKKSFEILTEDKLPKAVDFAFELKEKPGNPDGVELGETKAYIRDVEQTNGNLETSFGQIKFTQAGTYYFNITETPDTAGYDGFAYDETKWTLKVVIYDDKQGNLKVDEDASGYTYTRTSSSGTETGEAAQAEFTNSYSAAPTEYIPKAAKEITSAFEPEKKDFTFEIRWNEAGKSEGVIMPEDPTLTVNGEGSGCFDAIQFTHAGTYTFDISEDVSEKHPGYEYDTTHWKLTVTVEDRIATDGQTGEEKGQLTVTDVGYAQADTGKTDEEKALFTNTYAVTKTDSIIPKVEKVIEGDVTPEDKTFAFKLEAAKENPAGGASLEPGSGPAETTVEGSGVSTFDEIEFFKPGDYTFYITEEDTKENGYTYDESRWSLKAHVEDNDSVLKVTGYSYEKEGSGAADPDAALFENVYTITESAEFAPQVTKTVTGDVPEGRDQTFRFELTEKPGNPEGAVLPDDTEAEVKGSGETAFAPITFEQAGTYRFQICETNEGIAGYTYDGSVWTLTVEVTDIDSQLKVTDVAWAKDGAVIADAEAAAFENSYSTSETGYAPCVEKVITGDETPDDRTFTFNIEEDAENPEGAALDNSRAVSVGAGLAGFDEITFTKTGTYRFVITEESGKDTGYAYDDTRWTLTVEVEDVGGALSVRSAEYTAEDQTESVDHATFENSYDSAPVSYAPEVRKTVNGDVPEGEEETFTFTLEEAPGAGEAGEQAEGVEKTPYTMPEETKAVVTGSGKTTFGEIIFDEAGEYRFEIREEKGDASGYSYDGTVWNLTVSVADQGGRLTIADAAYEKAGENGEKSDAAQFVNTYEPRAVSYMPQVTKRIEGDQTPDDRTFWFELDALEENAEGAEILADRSCIKGAGDTDFNGIRFTKAGTYRFGIIEVKGSDSGYTYDEGNWILTVQIDDVDGVLAVKNAVYMKNGSRESNTEAAVFTNRYDASRSAAAAAKTGDSTDISRNIALMLGSAVFLAVFLLGRKRKSKNS